MRGTLTARVACVAFLCVGAALSGCSGKAQASTDLDNDSDEEASSQFFDPSGPAPGILRAMVDAPFTTAYGGTRRIDYFFDADGLPQTLAYRENVSADGTGAFHVEATEMLSAHPHPDLFLMLQGVRQGFVYRMRDVRIRNLGLFLENYEVAHTGTSQVAGVDCLELHARRRVLPDGDILMHVAADTGLVLRWEDRAPNGLVRGRMEFETYTSTPDLAGIELGDQRYDSRPIDLDTADEAEIGFEILKPMLPPTGYVHEESSVLVDDLGDRWVRSYYTDGMRRVAFMNRGVPVTTVTGAGFDPTVPQGAGVVRESHLGAWTIVAGQVAGHRVIVMGRVPSDELYQMLQSAL